MTEEQTTIETAVLERLQAYAATMAYLDMFQGITGKQLHGPDSGIYTSPNRGHSPFIRYVGDERVFAPWDNHVTVDCSDFFMFACADAESITTLEDYYLFRDVANLFLSQYTGGLVTDLTDSDDAWSLYFKESEDNELENWLGRSYCIMVWLRYPHPIWVDDMPEWLMPALERLAESKGKKIINTYAK
jgi:hypothetical protein